MKTLREMMDLIESAQQQYLWHGSTQQIPVLTPRQATDTGGAKGSNQNAIYATDNPDVAIAMGMTERGSDTAMFPNDPQMVLFKGRIRNGQNVYLHKLPKYDADGKPLFIQHGGEWYSRPDVKELKPIEIIPEPVDQHLNLIRTATPQDLALQKKYMKQGVAEDRNKTKYAKLLAIIAKERQEWITEFIGLPTTKEQKIQRKKEGALYAKAAELFAAGDIDGGSKIITQNIPPQHQDYFRHFMEEYKIPTNLVFDDAERNFPAPKGQWTGAFNGDAKLEKKIRDRLEQLHDSETMEPEEVYDQVADEFGIDTELLDQWLSREDDDEYYKESADPDAVKRIEQLVQYK